MVKLGSSIKEVLAHSWLEEFERDALREYILERCDIDSINELSNSELNADMLTSVESYFGGYMFLVENLPYDINHMIDNGCPDIRKMDPENFGGFDFAGYLTDDESLAIVGRCTNNAGGHGYLIRKKLMDKFPSIKKHIQASFIMLGDSNNAKAA